MREDSRDGREAERAAAVRKRERASERGEDVAVAFFCAAVSCLSETTGEALTGECRTPFAVGSGVGLEGGGGGALYTDGGFELLTTHPNTGSENELDNQMAGGCARA